MRVLLLGGEAFPEFPGGLNRYLHDLRPALARAGVESEAALVSSSAPTPGVRRVAPGSLPSRLLGMRRQAQAGAGEADVVDAHFALYAAAALSSPSVRRKPLLVHFHGPWAEESAAVGHRGARLAAKRRLERTAYGRADALVTLSYAFKRLLVERYGVSPWKVSVVRPAVDLQRFTPGDQDEARAALGLERDTTVALTVRRLVPRMGIDVLLRAWAQLEHGTLVIVGEGPEREILERMAGALDLSGRVRFAGRVEDELLPAYYRAADLCVLPSLSLEGFGLVVLEALACATPVVASDAGGLAEALHGLGPGLVVPRGDATALAERLSWLLAERARLPAPARCRSHAERFSPTALGERHRELYENAKRQRPGRHPARRSRRVVYVDHCARLSGGELALMRLIEALDGVEAHVILGEDGPFVSRLHQAGISVEVLALPAAVGHVRRGEVDRGRLGVLAPAATVLYVPRLASRLRSLAPGLVHTNTLKSGVYGSLAARLAGVPALWHLHDRLAPDYLPARAVRLMQRAVRSLPAALAVNSAATLQTVPRAPRGGAHVVANPVSLQPERALRPGLRRVGMVARLAPWKGQAVFLKAFAAAFADTDVEAVLVGAPLFGEEDYEAELRELARRLGIESRVDFRGFRDDVQSELERLDLFVHASVVPEPFGQSILEAMAAGLPVVATDGGGAAEIATDGRDALLHRPGDEAGLTGALRRMDADADLRRRLAAGGRRRAGDFSPERCAAQLSRVYASLLSAT